MPFNSQYNFSRTRKDFQRRARKTRRGQPGEEEEGDEEEDVRCC